MSDIAVLLSAYNGHAFLPAQLNSLAAQAGLGAPLLFWRDDGSTDATPDLLRRFSWPGGTVREAGALPPRQGAARSFLALLSACPEADAYAFCDQDDVWLPEKLSRGLRRLAALPTDRPALYCGRQRLVDEALKPVGLSPLPPRPPAFANALVQNIATGCTVILNPAARRLVNAAGPAPEGSMHDWWCYLLVTGAGGEVLFDAEPQILYRQHGRNAVGAAPSAARRGMAAAKRGPAAFQRIFAAHLEALDRASSLLTPEAAAKVAVLRAARQRGPLARLRALREVGAYRQRFSEDLVLRAWAVLSPG
ncbi:glycosyltransferase family 2 protein [Pseudoroseomonas globiformis]|uniref:Glycosyltransferase family 2 protein n=1 Tax=Teichococcus globiformis TaxID=2307229 RepID=A0ABV7G0K5_9PROT